MDSVFHTSLNIWTDKHFSAKTCWKVPVFNTHDFSSRRLKCWVVLWFMPTITSVWEYVANSPIGNWYPILQKKTYNDGIFLNDLAIHRKKWINLNLGKSLLPMLLITFHQHPISTQFFRKWMGRKILRP